MHFDLVSRVLSTHKHSTDKHFRDNCNVVCDVKDHDHIEADSDMQGFSQPAVVDHETKHQQLTP